MSKTIPILPCANIKEQAEFFTSIGFTVKGIYTSPNAYLAIGYDDIELHFWGSRKNVPSENASMCFIYIDNVDELNRLFSDNLKKLTGKIPRSGIPRISKVRTLKEDRRFTLVCPGGNTLWFGTVITPNSINFFRDINNPVYAKDFSLLYDLVYSKEDLKAASNLLPRLMKVREELSDTDLAKLLLLAIEIESVQENESDILELKALIASNQGEDWVKISGQLNNILAL